jgi:hypothetical protein
MDTSVTTLKTGPGVRGVILPPIPLEDPEIDPPPRKEHGGKYHAPSMYVSPGLRERWPLTPSRFEI